LQLDHLLKKFFSAPMKALAAEIVRKISKRLQWLSISVRELTGMLNYSLRLSLLTCLPGDMQLTKAEIAQTQIIVTTPEKWDVVTRKPTGEGEIASVCNITCIGRYLLMI
jgi:antiviral helicase SLH1